MSYPKYIAQSQVLNISCYRIKAAPALFAVSYSTGNGVVSQYAASGEFATKLYNDRNGQHAVCAPGCTSKHGGVLQ
jgi:hypothetical protein